MNHPPLSPEALLQQMRWRYSVKRFDPARRIPPEVWGALETALVLTPSSYGLQPWKFVVVADQATKDKLLPLSWNQKQIVECSHLVVMAIRKHVDAAHIDAHIARIAEVRGVTTETLAGYRRNAIADLVEGARSLIINEWATRQVYIALGNLMTAAACMGVDTCPMEGFDPVQYDKALGLARRGFAAVVACTLGYRAADDKYAGLPRVRFATESVVERI